jgi:hypothetical protein
MGLVEKLTTEELTARADSILVAEVTDVASYKEGDGNIYTRVTLSVEQTVKGAAQGEVVVKMLGGEVAGQVLLVEDAPDFQLGERVVVFLEKREATFSVVGGFQGKYTIDRSNMVGGMPVARFIEQIEGILAGQ